MAFFAMKRCFPGLGSHMTAPPPYLDGARLKNTCILPIGTCFVHCRTKKNHFHLKSGLNAAFFMHKTVLSIVYLVGTNILGGMGGGISRLYGKNILGGGYISALEYEYSRGGRNI